MKIYWMLQRKSQTRRESDRHTGKELIRKGEKENHLECFISSLATHKNSLHRGMLTPKCEKVVDSNVSREFFLRITRQKEKRNSGYKNPLWDEEERGGISYTKWTIKVIKGRERRREKGKWKFTHSIHSTFINILGIGRKGVSTTNESFVIIHFQRGTLTKRISKNTHVCCQVFQSIECQQVLKFDI